MNCDLKQSVYLNENKRQIMFIFMQFCCLFIMFMYICDIFFDKNLIFFFSSLFFYYLNFKFSVNVLLEHIVGGNKKKRKLFVRDTPNCDVREKYGKICCELCLVLAACAGFY